MLGAHDAAVLAATATRSVSQPDLEPTEAEMPSEPRGTPVVDHATTLALAATWPAPHRMDIDDQAVGRERHSPNEDGRDGDEATQYCGQAHGSLLGSREV